MSALLEITGLTAGFGSTPVLFEVSLDVQPGELVALIGANGAGKSTLLGALSGLVQIFDGAIRFDGHRLVGQVNVGSRVLRHGRGLRRPATRTIRRGWNVLVFR